MPKLRPETLAARREHILDAAERCFAHSGFHRCTMADICAEAGISAGALYVHFRSKEALIAGIAERDRHNLALQFGEVANAPDVTDALAKLAEYYVVDEPRYRRILTAEIGLEATRDETVCEIFKSVDDLVLQNLKEVVERAKKEDRIAPDLDSASLAQLLSVIGEGLMWRRAVVPGFDGQALMPAVIDIVNALLKPVPPAPSGKHTEIEEDA